MASEKRTIFNQELSKQKELDIRDIKPFIWQTYWIIERLLYVDIVDTEQRSLDLRVVSTHRQELLQVHNTVPIEIKFLKAGC